MRRDTGPGRRESVLHLKLPVGIGPTTYVLREAREYATQALPAQTARWVAREALIALGFRAFPVHVPVHAKSVT